MKMERTRGSKGLSRLRDSLMHGRFAYAIDRAVSVGIDPSRSLVVSGFWRSGTTWLQESLARLLGAKTAYEPFHPQVPGARALLSMHQRVAKTDAVLELYMQYCGTRELEGELRSAFDQALRSAVPGRGTRQLRTDLRECFRRRIVLKLVRGHLFLRAAQETFGMPIIHVYRDPRGVIASVKQTEWDWLFDHLRLAEQLLEPVDGRSEAFDSWRDAIEEYDGMENVARLAAYWAITERFLRDSLQASSGPARGRCVFVSYEELCRKREDFLVEMLGRLGLTPAASAERGSLDRESFSTSERRRGASVDDRVLGWRNVLSASEMSLIEGIVRRFGLEDRLFGGPSTESLLGSETPAERPAAR